MKTPAQFLMRIAKNDGNSTINYKPYEYSTEVKSLNFEKALNMLLADIEEMKKFFSAFGIDEEKATQAAYDIWTKHIIVF